MGDWLVCKCLPRDDDPRGRAWPKQGQAGLRVAKHGKHVLRGKIGDENNYYPRNWTPLLYTSGRKQVLITYISL